MHRTYSLPSKAHWFNSNQLNNYFPPHTLQSKDLIDPSVTFSNSNMKSVTNGHDLKGCCFDKAPKQSFFDKVNKTPGPPHYSQLQVSKSKSASKKSSLSKSKRFSESKEKTSGIGAYDLEKNILKATFQQAGTLTKAEKTNYFTHAQYQKYFIPGPGTYEPQKRIRYHSLLSLLPEKHPVSQGKRDKENKKLKPPGPMTYQVKTKSTVGCSVVMKMPLKESDEKIRERVTEMRKKKADQIKTGPGKYLKIQQWGKFSKSRTISNGLAFSSKPTKGVYH